MILDILQIAGFLICGFFSPIFALLAWKVWKCPDSLWKRAQRAEEPEKTRLLQEILR